jgi:hypothetical protein
MDWPLREMFLNFVARIKRRARDTYEFDYLIWAVLAPYQKKDSKSKPPKIPLILKR